ncbi:MAG: hypothetical protein U0172_04650 [Nitrospiraceae bacterium]
MLSTVLAVLLLTACAIPQVPYRTTYEDPVNFVRIEPDAYVLPEWAPSAHSHPVDLDEATVRQLLTGLQVQEHRIVIQRKLIGLAPREPAFRPQEIELLVPKIREALAQVQWNERVAFYLSQPQTSIKREITSGGIYIDGTKAHIILANRRIMYGIPAYGLIYDKRNPMRPTGPKGFDLYFDDTAAVVETHSNWLDVLLGLEKDELVIDLARMQEAPYIVRHVAPSTVAVAQAR